MEKLFRERRPRWGAGSSSICSITWSARWTLRARSYRALDRAALARKKPVSRALAREVLGALSNAYAD